MSIDAMKQALEALEQYTNVVTSVNDPNSWVTVSDGGKSARDAITALRAAIEQAEKQEPHSLLCVCGAEWDIYPDGKEVLASTAPRQWQGLTDEEIKDCEKQAMVNGSLPFEQRFFFARAIEAKLKEKNT